MSSLEERTWYLSIVGCGVFFLLFFMSLILISTIYICDGQQCDAFQKADQLFPDDRKNYILYIIDKLGSDGIWPFAMMTAIIVTFFVIIATGTPSTIQFIITVFLVTFLCIYGALNFLVHHYIAPTLEAVEDYIKDTKTENPKAGYDEIRDKAVEREDLIRFREGNTFVDLSCNIEG